MATYQQLFVELNSLLGSLERDNVTIDELSDKLNRGFELLGNLRAVLTATEAKLEEIVNARTSTGSVPSEASED